MTTTGTGTGTTVATAAPSSLSTRLSTRGGGVVVFRRRPLYSSGWLYDSRWAAVIDGP